MKGKYQFTYQCNQNWENMQPVSGGKHCAVCDTTVIDFSNMSPKEIKQHLEGKQHLCARFYDGQLDLNHVKEISGSRFARLLLFFTTLSLSIEAGNNHPDKAQQEKITQTDRINSTSNFQSELINTLTKPDTAQVKGKKPFIVTRKRKYYWTKRFPFISVVRIRLSGYRQGNVRFLED